MCDYSLPDTIALMTSDDYMDVGSLGFQTRCPRYILMKQPETMLEYLDILTARAEIEGIDLT